MVYYRKNIKCQISGLRINVKVFEQEDCIKAKVSSNNKYHSRKKKTRKLKTINQTNETKMILLRST